MVQNPSSLFTDQTGKELLGQAVSLLHFTVNDGDIHQYAASYIPSHWHKELELFMLLEGHIEIGIGDAIYRLQAGDGCFINTEVIHSFLALTSSPCRFRSFVFHPDFISGTPGSIFDTHYIRPFFSFRKLPIPFILNILPLLFLPVKRNTTAMNFRSENGFPRLLFISKQKVRQPSALPFLLFRKHA